MSNDAIRQFRPLSELNLMDNFLFHAMLMQEDIGEEFCRILLKTILGKEVRKVKITPQKELLGVDTMLHGIRMDAYIEDVSGSDAVDANILPDIYDIEPNQIYEKETLPRRLRYYHGLIDTQVLASGADYDKLPNVIIIFILPYDPFGKNRMVYTFQNQCIEDSTVNYQDGMLNMILYTKGTEGNPSQALKDMLHYIEKTTADNVTNQEIGNVHRLVDKVKSRKEVDISYMKSWEWDKFNRRLGKEEGWRAGRAEGLEEGRAEGLEVGRAEGLEVGRTEGIQALITTCLNLNVSREDILTQLKQNLSLDEASALEYLEKYYQQ